MIDKFIIIFIHSWLVSMVTHERRSHMLHHDNMVAADFFAASKFYDFLNQYCSKLLNLRR